MSHEDAIRLVKGSFSFVAAFEGEIPGSRRQECGNYLEHDLPEAKSVSLDMLSVLENWAASDLKYE